MHLTTLMPITNTYNDLVLIDGGNTMLINEFGRYVYLSFNN